MATATKTTQAAANVSKAFGGTGSLTPAQQAAVAQAQAAFAPPGSAPTPKTSDNSYGIDAKTGKPVGPGNDTPVTATPTTPTTPPPTPPAKDAPVNGQQVAAGIPNTQGMTSTITDPVTGQKFSRDTSDPNSTYQPVNKYKQAFDATQTSGLPVPKDAGDARAALTKVTPQEQDTSAVDNYISDDPGVNSLMQGVAKLLSPQNQTTSLMDDYQKLYQQSGLADINAEIINADKVINGTESDVRNEIEKAGGFGTESQVQAMTLARNKSLLARYNQLVQMKTDATNQLNTLSSLNAQDKQMAQTRLNTQIDTMFKMATFQQQAQNNVKEAFNNMVAKVGYAGAYQAYASNPGQLAKIEGIMGLGSGGLAKLAAQPDLDRQLKEAQIASANRANLPSMQFVSGTANQPSGVFNPKTGTFTPIQGNNEASAGALATSQANISSIGDVLKDPGLSGAVGPNALARFNIGDAFSGQKQNFIASVEQIRQQLTLDKLTQAKANGATFGALSDSEHELLANAATKLGSWAMKDSTGKVTGYDASEKDFKSELDKINNFAKLDYVLKGGNPEQVGVQETPDGKLWTMNSDGSMTEIR